MPRTGIPTFDNITQTLRGVGASINGQTYDVYRLSSKTSSSGIVSKSSLIASNVAAKFKARPTRSEWEVESSVRTIAYKGDLNALHFQPGDVFVQRLDSYGYDSSFYTLVSKRPEPHLTIFVATPSLAMFSRPESNPQHIDSGRVPQSVASKEREWPLTISAGSYSFQQSGTSASVPIYMTMSRLREYPKSDTSLGQLYDDTQRQTWDIFAPLLKGQPLIPRDIITGPNGDRYEITGVQAVSASFYGQLITVKRIRS